jgi:hypothetical protein
LTTQATAMADGGGGTKRNEPKALFMSLPSELKLYIAHLVLKRDPAWMLPDGVLARSNQTARIKVIRVTCQLFHNVAEAGDGIVMLYRPPSGGGVDVAFTSRSMRYHFQKVAQTGTISSTDVSVTFPVFNGDHGFHLARSECATCAFCKTVYPKTMLAHCPNPDHEFDAADKYCPTCLITTKEGVDGCRWCIGYCTACEVNGTDVACCGHVTCIRTLHQDPACSVQCSGTVAHADGTRTLCSAHMCRGRHMCPCGCGQVFCDEHGLYCMHSPCFGFHCEASTRRCGHMGCTNILCGRTETSATCKNCGVVVCVSHKETHTDDAFKGIAFCELCYYLMRKCENDGCDALGISVPNGDSIPVDELPRVSQQRCKNCQQLFGWACVTHLDPDYACGLC